MADPSGTARALSAVPARPPASGPVGRLLSGPRGRAAAAARRTRSVADGAALTARSVLTPAGLAGIAVEAAWCAAHLAVYPLGVLGERNAERDTYGLEGLAPMQRGLVIGDVEAAGTPILLVHGMVDNRSIFTVLRRGLRRRGFGRVLSTNYSPATNDVRTAAADLAAQVEVLVAESGYERIHVVGHSLGGLIARYYVQRLGGDERVHTLVTMGTPHAGTLPAYLWPAELCRQLRPGSDLYAELEQPAPGCRTRFIVYWSDLDQMIVPKRNARLDHPDIARRNILVRSVGHMSLPIQPRLAREISDALSQLHADGSTMTQGVTPLVAAPPTSRARKRSRTAPPGRARTGPTGKSVDRPAASHERDL